MLVKNAFALIYNLAEIGRARSTSIASTNNTNSNCNRESNVLYQRSLNVETSPQARYFLMVTRNIQLGISLRITYLRIDVILHQTRHAPLFFWEIGIE